MNYGSAEWALNWIPVGTTDGSNRTFTLRSVPAWGSLFLFKGGIRQILGIDFTLSGSTITFTTAPAAGVAIICDYAESEPGSSAPGSIPTTETRVPSGSALITVQEGDATVDAAVTTLDFGAGFDVTSSPAGEANIALDLDEYDGSAGLTQITDTNGNELVKFVTTASAVNEITITNSASGLNPTIEATGDDATLDITVKSKSTGKVKFVGDELVAADKNSVTYFNARTVASGVNYLQVDANITTRDPSISAVGSDANINVDLIPKGSGRVLENGSAVYKSGGPDVALADGGTGASLADPNADRMLFWDDSGGAVDWLAPNTGLAISGTDLNVGHVLLDGAAITDSAAGTVVRGDIITGNSTPKWSRLAIGAAKTWLKSDGTDASWAAAPVYAAELFRPATANETTTATATNPATVSTTLTNLNTTYLYIGGIQMVSLDDFATIRILARVGNTAAQSGTISVELLMDGTTSLVTATTTNVGLTNISATAAIAQTGVHYIGARIKSSVATDDPLASFIGFELY